VSPTPGPSGTPDQGTSGDRALRPAATVLLLRQQQDGDGGLAVFMVRRNRKVAFMPSAWVFPGGRVDDADALLDHPRVRGGESAAARMGLSRPEALPFLVAAVRETLEESGIWLGEGRPPAEARDALNADACTLAEVLERYDLHLDLDVLHPWSWWVTPEAEPRRYDTRFFAALVDSDEGVHDAGETVESAWLSVDDASARADRGELPMAPPTWWTLRELSAARTSTSVLDGGRPSARICPVLKSGPDGLSLLLPGHPEHPDGPIAGLPVDIRFSQGRWWARS